MVAHLCIVDRMQQQHASCDIANKGYVRATHAEEELLCRHILQSRFNGAFTETDWSFSRNYIPSHILPQPSSVKSSLQYACPATHNPGKDALYWKSTYSTYTHYCGLEEQLWQYRHDKVQHCLQCSRHCTSTHIAHGQHETSS
jgi:hypothetical protein